MRPIIYDDAPPEAPPARIHHPYSLSEFAHGDEGGPKPLQLQFKLQRQQLDEFHHNYWFDSNTRFEAAKAAVLSSLPPSAEPIDKERTLSEFYQYWHTQEAPRTDAYTREWRRQNYALVKLAARVEYHKLADRVFNMFSWGSRNA